MDEVRSFWQRKGLAAAPVLEPEDVREREAVLTG